MAYPRSDESKPKQSLGFLTVLECPRDGLFGGYLALNFLGRPLEFRCTAPIKPSRAQQILYGPTLNSYLYGEQIGRSLLDGVTHDPLVVCTDHPAVLAVRDFVDIPVALVEIPAGEAEGPESTTAEAGSSATDPGQKTWRVHAAHAPDSPLRRFHLGHNRLAAGPRAEADQATILDRLADLADSFDLAEPFVRIREAIEEARRAGGG